MKKKFKEYNQTIEDRIEMEIIVDAYNESEQFMGWYCYLQDTMTVPFKAKCIKRVSTSPLKIDEIVEVIGMNDDENCECDMFVQIKWKENETLCVPLRQLEGINIDDKTKQALGDWSYWLSQG